MFVSSDCSCNHKCSKEGIWRRRVRVIGPTVSRRDHCFEFRVTEFCWFQMKSEMYRKYYTDPETRRSRREVMVPTSTYTRDLVTTNGTVSLFLKTFQNVVVNLRYECELSLLYSTSSWGSVPPVPYVRRI